MNIVANLAHATYRTKNNKLLTLLILMFMCSPAAAHHPMGGRAPANFFEGIVSGFAHPIIGVDHFVFMLAVGILAVGLSHRYWTPLVFVLTTVAGTLIHLAQVNLLLVEAAVALSVIIAGLLLLAYRQRQYVLLILCGLAGLFHGYAYGEAVVGSESTPIVAYLVGFSIIQFLLISLFTWLASALVIRVGEQTTTKLRYIVGSAVSAIGLLFLALTMS